MQRGRSALARLLAISCLFAMGLYPQCLGAQPTAASTPAHPVVGVVRVWGSPQMSDLLRLYEEGFRRLQPGVAFENRLHSTLTAVAGVYTGSAEIGLLGRGIWPLETQAFESVRGHPPTLMDIATGAYDVPKATFALMLFVHRSNPLSSLSTDQLASLFGRPDHGTRPPTWGDVGLTGPWAQRPVHLYGFEKENDKAILFRAVILQHASGWSCDLREFGNGPDGVDAGQRILQAVAADPDGIGISNIHYATPDVRVLALALASGVPVLPTRATVAARSYPLFRSVSIVVDPPLSPATAEFLEYILSRQGADDVVRQGDYLPLPPAIAEAQRTRLLVIPGKKDP